MATRKGQQPTYSATIPQKRVVTDRILYTDAWETPGIFALGLNNESSFGFANGPGGPNQPYEWLLDTRLDRIDAINTAALTSDSTSVTMTVDSGTNFQVGDIVLVDLEYMHITGISTNALTVTRDYGGTQATHANSAVVTIVGRARIEGTDSTDSAWTEATSATNATQIFHKEIDISRSAANLQRYGIGNLVEREIDKAMTELLGLLNLTLYHGQRAGGNVTTASSMGGLETYITTNINTLSSTPALTEANIQDELQDCWDAGGAPNLMLCNSWGKRKVASFYAGSIRTERSERMGGMVIDRIEGSVDGNELNLVLDRHCPTDSLYILDTSTCGFVTIDPFFWEPLGKVGDTAAFGQVVGEYSFVLARENWMSAVVGFSTSA